jgi:hypothetical protein
VQIETSSDVDRECKDLIGEAYEAAHNRFPDFAGFSGIDALWDRVQEVLGRKGSLEICTTGTEDSEARGILGEVFEEASRAALEDGHVDFASEYMDYQMLWERLTTVLKVSV